MSDQQATPFWKKLPDLVISRINGRAGSPKKQDEKAEEHKPLNVFYHDYDITRLASPMQRVLISQALLYRERIEGLVEHFPSTRGRNALVPVAAQVEECVNGLFRLALKIDPILATPVQSTEVLDTDATVPEIITPDSPPADTPSDGVQSTDEMTIRLPDQRQAVDISDEQQFEDTLTALGTVYSLMLLQEGRDVEEPRANRMTELLAGPLLLLNKLAPASVAPSDTSKTDLLS